MPVEFAKADLETALTNLGARNIIHKVSLDLAIVGLALLKYSPSFPSVGKLDKLYEDINNLERKLGSMDFKAQNPDQPQLVEDLANKQLKYNSLFDRNAGYRVLAELAQRFVDHAKHMLILVYTHLLKVDKVFSSYAWDNITFVNVGVEGGFEKVQAWAREHIK